MVVKVTKILGQKLVLEQQLFVFQVTLKRPGMYEIEMGMTINDLLLNIGGGSSTDKEDKNSFKQEVL